MPNLSDSPAYPLKNNGGITLREYAAIILRVPDSGLEWLDNMIRRSMRVDLANSFLVGTVVARSSAESHSETAQRLLTDRAYQLADVMKKAGGYE